MQQLPSIHIHGIGQSLTNAYLELQNLLGIIFAGSPQQHPQHFAAAAARGNATFVCTTSGGVADSSGGSSAREAPLTNGLVGASRKLPVV
jgi:hypothetical protein